jgi:cell wall-associated NlpC family hydrolase
MSAKSEQVAADALADVATNYHWAPFGGACSLYDWANGGTALGNVGSNAANAICCFEYPMLLAARRGYINQQGVQDIFTRIMKTNFSASSFATTWTKLWTDWPSFACSNTYWRPRRGDLVFYADQHGELNHVVIALGANAAGQIQVVSFGEGLAAPAQAAVNLTTVDALRQAGHISVRFVSPPWY